LTRLLFAAILLTGCAKHYRVQGVVLQTNPADRTIVVSHRPIDRYMPSMAMPFHVDPKGDLSKLTPGTRVDFDLYVGKQNSIAKHVKAQAVKLETPVAAPANKLALGATTRRNRSRFRIDRSIRPRRSSC
jgi:Cu/Ag efflux protein CusF